MVLCLPATFDKRSWRLPHHNYFVNTVWSSWSKELHIAHSYIKHILCIHYARLYSPYMSTRSLPTNTITSIPTFIKYTWTCFHCYISLILEHAWGTLTKQKISRGLIPFETICEDTSNASLSWLCWVSLDIVAYNLYLMS